MIWVKKSKRIPIIDLIKYEEVFYIEDMIEQVDIKALQEWHDYTVLSCMTEEPDTFSDGTGHTNKKRVVLSE